MNDHPQHLILNGGFHDTAAHTGHVGKPLLLEVFPSSSWWVKAMYRVSQPLCLVLPGVQALAFELSSSVWDMIQCMGPS